MVNYKELVEFIVKRLVTQPESVSVESTEVEDGNNVRVRVAHEEREERQSTPLDCWQKLPQSNLESELMLISSRINT